MADFSVPMSSTYAQERTERQPFAATAVLLASLLAAAGVIHLVMVPSHAGEWAVEGVGFAVAGWLQLGLAAKLAVQPRRWASFASVIVNMGLIGLWIVSRTSGFPVGPHAHHAESVTLIDGVTVAMQAVAILAAMASVTFPSMTSGGVLNRGISSLVPLAVVGMTTLVLVSPSARTHAHDAHDGHTAVATGVAAVDGHAHAVGSATVAVANGQALASTDGQATAAVDQAVAGQAVTHVHTADAVALPADGQPAVDASTGDAVATQGATAEGALADGAATDGHTHDHGTTTAPAADDKGLSLVMNGHQHDSAPLPMDGPTTALLAHQLARTAELVAMYPTVADAEAAGYRRQGPFAPGLGTHYGKGGETIVGESINDDNVLKPMLIFDGSEPTSKIAGFMYIAFGTKSTPEGFAGPNDIWHYHTNVCVVMRPDGSTDAPLGADQDNVSKELCDSYGGFLIDNTGYMMHLWTVPGYESSKGVFHEVNPALPCPDGTFYSKPLDELGASLTTCLNA